MTNAATSPQVVNVSQRTAGAPRVAIVRLSAVGDCVQTMPLACAVRAHWPNVHITWIVEKAAAPLVQANPAVDRVIVLPKRFATSPRMLLALRRELHRYPIDFTVDPQGLTKSGIVAWLSGAKRRIGFARPVARELGPWLQTELVQPHAEHRVERYLELLQPLGIETPAVDFGLHIPTAAQEMVRSFTREAGIASSYVVLNPGAGWDSKRWPHERYSAVARSLQALGLKSVVTWAGSRERTWAEAIVAASPSAAILAPPTTLLELAALLNGARLFCGSDTGPLHLAAAVGTPCVGLFGASPAAGCGPYGIGHTCLQEALDSSPGRKRPGADNWAIRQITATKAVKACERLLFGHNSRADAA